VQDKAKPVENWISAAECALNPSSEDTSLVELSVWLLTFCTFCYISHKIINFSVISALKLG